MIIICISINYAIIKAINCGWVFAPYPEHCYVEIVNNAFINFNNKLIWYYNKSSMFV